MKSKTAASRHSPPAIRRAGGAGRADGVPLKVRSAILGHALTSSLSMTEDHHAHLVPGDLEEAKTALAA